MKGKFITLALMIVAVILMLAASAAYADVTVSINGFAFTNASLEAAVTAAIDNETITGLSDITHIEVTAGVVTSADWDYIKTNKGNLTKLTTLTVGDAVTTVADIPEQLLVDNTSIQAVSIAKVTVVGQYSFVRCTALERASFPQATNFGWGVFIDCAALKDVNLPLATILGGYMFDSCSALSQASFPSVTEIGNNAFVDCTKLVSASFPKATMIRVNAFSGCTALTSLSLPATPPTLDISGWFDGCPDKRYLTLVDKYGAPLTGDALNSAIDAYDANEGDPSDNLWHGWTLPERPQITLRINDGAAITHAGLEAAVGAAIDSSVISALSDITSIKVTRGYVMSEDWGYIKTNNKELTALTTLTVEDAVTTVAPLPEYFLRGNTSIKSVSIAKATEIGRNAFLQCPTLESASFPQVTLISNRAFQNCINLKNANFPAATYLGEYSFEYCAMVEASFPNAANIGIYAFSECSKLTRASFPKVSIIGTNVFKYCMALTLLFFPAAPPELSGESWFLSCPSPRYLTAVDANGDPLSGTALDSAMDAYDADGDGKWEGWTLIKTPRITVSINNSVASGHASLEAAIEASGVPIPNITTIEVTAGEVASEDWEYIKTNKGNLSGLTTLIVSDSVTSVEPIPDDFLRENASIKTVSIAKATGIGDNAFSGCSALKDANFPAATNLGVSPFEDCINLLEANFPSVTEISVSAFQSCGELKSASFPNAIYIDMHAFDNCTAFAALSLPSWPPYLDNGGWFDGCPSPRNLALVDANGNWLEGEALDGAISSYEADLTTTKAQASGAAGPCPNGHMQR